LQKFSFRKTDLDEGIDSSQDMWQDLQACLVHIYGPRKNNPSLPNCTNSEVQDFFNLLSRHA
jgi:hypothetical protein